MFMSNAMKPHGLSLLDYYNGNKGAAQINRRDDGKVAHVPVSVYFRSYDELLPVEYSALELCRGMILNVGAGTGVHSSVLQEKGFEVCALDVSEEACQVMRDKGRTMHRFLRIR
jgi:2-polyprenyl-3-methyl-5-hydroxy-6-metoxy-1,4-benzoquinol methylase